MKQKYDKMQASIKSLAVSTPLKANLIESDVLKITQTLNKVVWYLQVCGDWVRGRPGPKDVSAAGWEPPRSLRGGCCLMTPSCLSRLVSLTSASATVEGKFFVVNLNSNFCLTTTAVSVTVVRNHTESKIQTFFNKHCTVNKHLKLQQKVNIVNEIQRKECKGNSETISYTYSSLLSMSNMLCLNRPCLLSGYRSAVVCHRYIIKNKTQCSFAPTEKCVIAHKLCSDRHLYDTNKVVSL